MAKQSPPTILVVGSINTDLVAQCPRLPRPGETLLGTDFRTYPGGKGANAATAAARLIDRDSGQTVAMVGAVGGDANGAAMVRNLRDREVIADHVREVEDASTGVAMIAVADDGDNSIIVVPGANGCMRPREVELAVRRLAPAVMLMQLEIPLETVQAAAALGRRFGARVLLDPAPAPVSFASELTADVDIILPNAGELGQLTGLPMGGVDDAIRAAAKLRGRNPITIVVKRGAEGALIVDDDGSRLIPAPRVDVVDTTGAGDCFDGALAAGLLDGWSLDRAVRFATHAAALACTRIGAQSAQPTRSEVRALLKVG